MRTPPPEHVRTLLRIFKFGVSILAINLALEMWAWVLPTKPLPNQVRALVIFLLLSGIFGLAILHGVIQRRLDPSIGMNKHKGNDNEH